jgi:hypothetical protein
MTERLREHAPNFPSVSAALPPVWRPRRGSWTVKPLLRFGREDRARRATAAGNWRVKSVANGVNVKPRSSQSIAASSEVEVARERQKYGSLPRMPQSKVKSICRLNHLPMAVAACVSLRLLGGSWTYIREQARAFQAMGLAASSEDHPPKSVRNIVKMPADPPPGGTLTPVTSEPTLKAPVGGQARSERRRPSGGRGSGRGI